MMSSRDASLILATCRGLSSYSSCVSCTGGYITIVTAVAPTYSLLPFLPCSLHSSPSCLPLASPQPHRTTSTPISENETNSFKVYFLNLIEREEVWFAGYNKLAHAQSGR